jgi:hypothetical protein
MRKGGTGTATVEATHGKIKYGLTPEWSLDGVVDQTLLHTSQPSKVRPLSSRYRARNRQSVVQEKDRSDRVSARMQLCP